MIIRKPPSWHTQVAVGSFQELVCDLLTFDPEGEKQDGVPLNKLLCPSDSVHGRGWGYNSGQKSGTGPAEAFLSLLTPWILTWVAAGGISQHTYFHVASCLTRTHSLTVHVGISAEPLPDLPQMRLEIRNPHTVSLPCRQCILL